MTRHSSQLAYFLDRARAGNLAEMLRAIYWMSEEDLLAASLKVCVPECDCSREILPCGCDPDVPAHYRVHVRCDGCGWRGKESSLDRWPACPTCRRKRLRRSRNQILVRPSCGCPVKFVPCARHQPEIPVPFEVEARLMWALNPGEYEDLPLPPTAATEIGPDDRRRILALMIERLQSGTAPQHPQDGWIDQQSLQRAAEAFKQAFSGDAA